MSTRRIHIPQYVIAKSPGLLWMQYSVGELSALLRIPDRTLRDWLQFGAPHIRDSRGHLWINGLEFAAWIKGQRKPKRAARLERDEAYCLRCNEVVKMVDPEVRRIRGKLLRVRGRCPVCGCTINRGDRLPEGLSRNSSVHRYNTRTV
jgi:hypothetical protein